MEAQLFTWEDWMPVDYGILQFDECVLKVKIGQYEKGTKFPSIVVNFEEGKLSLFKGSVFSEPSDVFNLQLSVVEN